MMPTAPKQVPSLRRGMSLLEVVLASGLCVLLILAVYSAMDQAYRLSSTGKDDLQRMQLARAILRRMELDVRSVTYAPTVEAADADSALFEVDPEPDPEDPDPEEPVPEVTVLSPIDQLLAGSVGLIGTATRLELHVSRPRRELSFGPLVDDASVTTRVSDLRSVIYDFQGSGSSTLVDADGQPLIGLIRTEGDRMAVLDVEAAGGAGEIMTLPQALAPEANSVLFRYFDGTTWYEEWDTPTLGMLPRAIEVSIQFEPTSAAMLGGTAAAVAAGTTQFRFVIALPTADPTGGESQL
ncbi:hypothetical protein [Planctellipticum variicoloris]|uniref:hypothetical protein n=1 Tax=Planctellipticum variicoloris TaxID=3064265 RepID=UPI00301325D0|nr:type II secretion system protein GspJ [Planctomycetaceae bacterium SH412]